MFEKVIRATKRSLTSARVCISSLGGSFRGGQTGSGFAAGRSRQIIISRRLEFKAKGNHIIRGTGSNGRSPNAICITQWETPKTTRRI